MQNMSKNKSLTQQIRRAVRQDTRTHYDEAYLLLSIYEHYGFELSDAQRTLINNLPKSASVMRIARRELKARRAKRILL